MDEQKEKRMSGVQRYSVASLRTFCLHLIPFDEVCSSLYVFRIVDISVIGVGIETEKPFMPGMVCFEQPISGHKFGVVTWCRRNENGYRAGISFLTLPYEKEQYILNEVFASNSVKPLRDPEKIIASMLESMKRETNG